MVLIKVGNETVNVIFLKLVSLLSTRSAVSKSGKENSCACLTEVLYKYCSPHGIVAIVDVNEVDKTFAFLK